MASWLIRMDSSSGKSSLIRFGDLLRTPCCHPGPITPVRLVASLPLRRGRTSHDLLVSATNDTGELVLDVLAQPVVADQLGRLGTPRPPFGMPLRDRGLVVEPIRARRGITAQLTRDGRRRTPEPTRNLTNTGTLRTP